MTIRIVLAGGGHAHLAVLADWIGAPPEGTERWLVTSHRRTAYSGMLPGWIAGDYPAEALTIDLEPLARLAGARLVIADVVGLDPERHLLELSTGVRLGFDLLSFATGGESDISHLAALGDRLLPVRPVLPFMARWESFVAGRDGRAATRVAVVGGGADAKATAIIAGMIDISRRLGIDVIAESIESQNQFAALAQLGCAYGQGYHVSRPLAASDLAAWRGDAKEFARLSA